MTFVVDSDKRAKRYKSLKKSLPYVGVKTAIIDAKLVLGDHSWPVVVGTIVATSLLVMATVMLLMDKRQLDRQPSF